MSYRAWIIDPMGRGVAIEAESPSELRDLISRVFPDDETEANADPWWRFLHSLPPEMKGSEHVGAVMEIFGSKEPTPHTCQAFAYELDRRIRRAARGQNGPSAR